MSELLDIGTLKGAVEIDNRLEGTLETVMKGVEKFGEEFLGEFKGLAASVSVVGAAVLGVAATISTLAAKGSEVNDVTGGFNRLAGGVENANKIIEAMREGTGKTIQNIELMATANRLLNAEVKASAEDFGTMTAASRVLANQGLGSIETNMNAVTRAMQTGGTQRLKLLGIEIDQKDAEVKYADTLGVTASQLTSRQSLEARRVAILEALNKLVKDAGEQESSFGDLLNRTAAALQNWAHNLEAAVAANPAVIKAYKDISAAISEAFGGDSQTLLDWIVKWSGRFAEAVSTYGPPVVHALGAIKDTVVAIWNSVTAAYDALPNWLKTVAKDAIITTAVIYASGKALDTLLGSVEKLASGAASSSRDMLTDVASLGTISDAVQNLYKHLSNLGNIGSIIDKVKGIGAAVSGAYASFSLGTVAVEGWVIGLGAMALPLLAGVVAITSLGAVITNVTLRWKIWQEEKERGAANQRQEVVDASNLAQINQALGTKYTDLNEAVKAATEASKKKLAAFKEDSAATKDATAAAERYKLALQATVDQFTVTATKLDTLDKAWEKQSLAIKMSSEGQKVYLQIANQMRNSGQELSEQESKDYEWVVKQKNARLAYNAALLNSSGLTKDQIAAMKNEGMTMDEIAEKYHVLASDVSTYESTTIAAAEKVRDLEMKASDDALKASGNNINVWIDNENRKYENTIRQATLANTATIGLLAAEKAAHDRTVAAEIADRVKQMQGSKDYYDEIAKAAENDLAVKLAASNKFTNTQIMLARLEATEKRRAANYWYTEANDVAGKAIDDMNKVADSTSKIGDAAEKGANSFDKMGNKIAGVKDKVETTMEAIIRMGHAIEGGTGSDFGKAYAISTKEFLKTQGVDPTGQAYDSLVREGYSDFQAQQILMGWAKKTDFPDAGKAKKETAEETPTSPTYTGPATTTSASIATASVRHATGGIPAGGAPVINFHPGSFVFQYPIMNDINATNHILKIFGDAVVAKVTNSGVKVGG